MSILPDDRTALVTGSSGAIGTAICRALLEAGFQVVGVDLRRPVQAFDWQHITLDIADPHFPGALSSLLADASSPVTCLVNNAGIYRALELESSTAEDFDAVMAVNLRAPFLLSRVFALELIKTGASGSIINISSVSGRIGSPDVLYGASKGGLIALTKGMSMVLAPHDIRVNTVAPGLIDSEMLEIIPPDRRDQYRRGTPMRRFGRPDEVAAVVSSLATGVDSFLSGAVIDVNGGLY